MRSLQNEVASQIGGQAMLLAGVALAGEADVIEIFNTARNDEYEEIDDGCREFLADLAKETTSGHFRFEELEAHEEDLEKLQALYRKIHGRNLLGARGRDVTDANLEACGKTLDVFSAEVYRAANA
jgi:hypothetical protein